MTFFHILIAIFSFGMIIFVHELFHFLAARIVGVKPKEFAVGFGRSLLVYQKTKTTVGSDKNPTVRSKRKIYFLPKSGKEKFDLEEISYHLKVLPLGGYVLFERPIKTEDGEYKTKGEYLNVHPLKRMIISVAGPIGNFVLAFILLFTLLSPYVSLNPEGKVNFVEENSIAHSLGLNEDDRILKLNDKHISEINDFSKYIASQESLCVTWENKNGIKTDCIETNKEKTLGVMFSFSVFEGIQHSALMLVDLIKQYTTSFLEVVLNLEIKQLNGPIGTVDALQQTVPVYESFISMLILINIALGSVNLFLPLSITDGGKIFIDFICLIFRKKYIKTTVLDIISVGIMLLLFAFTFFLDINRIIERIFS